MDKTRSLKTRFWTDNWVLDLDPVEKLLFIYMLTNESTNLAGIYELHLRKMAFETGIDREMVEKILTRFENDGKITYRYGYVFVQNFTKHQKYNPSMLKNVSDTIENLPDTLKNDNELTSYIQAVYKLCTPRLQMEIEMESEMEIEMESESESEKPKNPTIDEVKDYFLKNGYQAETGERAFHYYNSGGWKDSRGRPVRNWKQKMRGVWFKPEDKVPERKEIINPNAPVS